MKDEEMRNQIILQLMINGFLLMSLNRSPEHIQINESDLEYEKKMKMCETYILNYSPIYYYNGDTFIVARFSEVPDSINSFLISCAEKNDFRPLKYSSALIMRHNMEYLKVNGTDYIIGDGLVLGNNGFIVLLRKAMKINDNPDDSLYFPFFTGDICRWINDKKETIEDFNFVEKYKRNERQILKQLYK